MASQALTAAVRRLLTITTLVAMGGCARPLPGHSVDPVSLGHEVQRSSPGQLSFEEALREAVRHSPELAALQLRIAGAGGWPAAEPVGLEIGRDSDDRAELGLEFDVLSLFGLGPQRAEMVLARLRRTEAGLALQARAREVAAEIAEAYAVDLALAESAPEFQLLDPEAFIKAGLAPTAAAEAKTAATAALRVDAAARATTRAGSRLRVERHVGLRPVSALVLVLPTGPWPNVPEPDAGRLLAADPEVLRSIGAYEVARGDLLRAQADRDPGLVLKPAVALDPMHFFGAIAFRLPVGAGPQIRAAHARMEAGRLDVRSAVLAALEEAQAARAAWTLAEEVVASARTQMRAALALSDAERARVETQGEGFGEAVLAGNAVVESSGALREALVEAARARVRAAVAAGWPFPSLPVQSGCSRNP